MSVIKKILLPVVLSLIFLSCKDIKSQEEAIRRLNETKIYVGPNNDLQNISLGDVISLEIHPDSLNDHQGFFDDSYQLVVSKPEDIKGLEKFKPSGYDCKRPPNYFTDNYAIGCFKVIGDIEVKYHFYGSYAYRKGFLINKFQRLANSDDRFLKIKVKENKNDPPIFQDEN